MLRLLDLRKLRLSRSLAKTMLDLRRLRQAHSLAKLASLTQNMHSLLGLLDLRRLRLTRSLAEPTLLACTHVNKFEKITFFRENANLR